MVTLLNILLDDAIPAIRRGSTARTVARPYTLGGNGVAVGVVLASVAFFAKLSDAIAANRLIGVHTRIGF